MTRSDDSLRSAQGRASYLSGWEATMRLVRGGMSWSGNERNCAYLNVGDGTFANVSAVSGFDFPDDGRGLALADWDDDGDLDLWVTNRTGPRLRFLRNRGQHRERGRSHVSLRLRGTVSNRDAIGARVELELPSGERRIRTVRAGDGFLSQSSKELTFGLPDGEGPVRATVRWPTSGGGAAEVPEVFGGLVPGRRHLLVEGSGGPALLPAREIPEGGLALAPGEPEERRDSDAARIVLPFRPPLPAVRMQAGEGGETTELDPRGPMLLNLWAGWCVPCVAELGAIAEAAERVRAAGLRVVALGVDGLGEDEGDPAEARAVLERIGFPFEHGRATEELLDKVERLQGAIFDRRATFSVPFSLLVDSEGRIAEIHRGPVDLEALLASLPELDRGEPDSLERSVPFPGRWARRPFIDEEAFEELDRAFTDAYPGDAARFLDAALERVEERRAYRAQQLLGEGDLDLLEARLREKLGNARFHSGAFRDAVDAYARVIELDPDAVTVRVNVGAALLEMRRIEPALRHLRRAAELAPDLAAARAGLGRALAAAQSFEEAAAELEEALRLDPSDEGARENLELVRRALE